MQIPALSGLQDPNRAWMVLLLGLLLVYRECVAPGRFLPGIAGAVFFFVAADALLRHPLTLLGMALLAAGMCLLVLQAFKTWFGVPGLAGTLALVFGARELVAVPQIRMPYALAAVPFALISTFLFRGAVKARRNKRRVQ